MSLSTDMRTFLLADSGVSALVGSRVYRGTKNQGDGNPSLVLNVFDDRVSYAHDGPFALREASVQVDCYDDDWVGADALADAVESALSGHSGALGDRTCEACFQENRIDDDFSPEFGEERSPSRVILDFRLMHHA